MFESQLMRWYFIFQDLLITLFYMAMISDPMSGHETQSSQSEGYCLKIILTVFCSNVLLNFAYISGKVVEWIKKFRASSRISAMTTSVTEHVSALNHEKKVTSEKINQDFSIEQKDKGSFIGDSL